jgi:hypothetical protein
MCFDIKPSRCLEIINFHQVCSPRKSDTFINLVLEIVLSTNIDTKNRDFLSLYTRDIVREQSITSLVKVDLSQQRRQIKTLL